MTRRNGIILLVVVVALVLINVLVHYFVVRVDMTDDQRYSLHDQTKQLLSNLDDEVTIVNYLDGEVNPGFRRLHKSFEEIGEELSIYTSIKWQDGDPQTLPEQLHPIVVHDKQDDGKTIQTTIYPYAKIIYHSRSIYVSLLTNQAGLSGEENLNVSIENLEFTIAEALQNLCQTDIPKIAFLEGHGELPEALVYDVSLALNKYFQVDRGVLGNDVQMLDPYQVLIIADPQMPFSERDKYIIDQYIMRGGAVLWVLSGVQYSEEMFAKQGMTPIVPLDLHLEDMLFRYGFRVVPALIEDVQCMTIPINVSADPQQPNLQPIPAFYAPLLLTSQKSNITRNLTQLTSEFVSPVELVGEDDGLTKEVLIASSTATRVVGTPNEINLQDIYPDSSQFIYAYIPVAFSLQGRFNSYFAHRIAPDSLVNTRELIPLSKPTRQIVIASGSIIRNDWQQDQPLPAGFDRFSGRQFANRDFIVNAVLYLANQTDLIALRSKTIDLRLLNQQVAYAAKPTIQWISIVVPIAFLLLLGVGIGMVRKLKFAKR